MKRSLDDLAYEYGNPYLTFRGLYLRLAGTLSGTYIMQLDHGDSRWLYDYYSLRKETDMMNEQLLRALSEERQRGGPWINSSIPATLCFTDEKFSLEHRYLLRK